MAPRPHTAPPAVSVAENQVNGSLGSEAPRAFPTEKNPPLAKPSLPAKVQNDRSAAADPPRSAPVKERHEPDAAQASKRKSPAPRRPSKRQKRGLGTKAVKVPPLPGSGALRASEGQRKQRPTVPPPTHNTARHIDRDEEVSVPPLPEFPPTRTNAGK